MNPLDFFVWGFFIITWLFGALCAVGIIWALVDAIAHIFK